MAQGADQVIRIGVKFTLTVPDAGGSPPPAYVLFAPTTNATTPWTITGRVLTYTAESSDPRSGRVQVNAVQDGVIVDTYFFDYTVTPAFANPVWPSDLPEANGRRYVPPNPDDLNDLWPIRKSEFISIPIPELESGYPEEELVLANTGIGLAINQETRKIEGRYTGDNNVPFTLRVNANIPNENGVIQTAPLDFYCRSSVRAPVYGSRGGDILGVANQYFRYPLPLPDETTITPPWDIPEGADLSITERARFGLTFSATGLPTNVRIDQGSRTTIPGSTVTYLSDSDTPPAIYGIPPAAYNQDITITCDNAVDSTGGEASIVFSMEIAPINTLSPEFGNLIAAGNTDPVGLSAVNATVGSTPVQHLIVTDGKAPTIFNYDVPTKLHRGAYDITDLLSQVLLSPSGVHYHNDKLYIVDALARMIFVVRYSTKQWLPDEYIPLRPISGNLEPRGISGNSTTLWVVYSRTNAAIAYDITTRQRDSAKDITAAFLPSGIHEYHGIHIGATHAWLADTVDNSAYCVKISTTPYERDSQYDFRSLLGRVTPVVNPAADIPAEPFVTDNSFTGFFSGMAYNGATDTTYLLGGGTAHAFVNNVYDSTKSVTLGGSGLTFDGTGLLSIVGNGLINGRTLNNQPYTPAGLPSQATVQAAFGTPYRIQGMTLMGTNLVTGTLFIVNRDGKLRAFRNGARLQAMDVEPTVLFEAVNQLQGRPVGTTASRFSGLANDGTFIWVLDRQNDCVICLLNGAYNAQRSLSSELILSASEDITGTTFSSYACTFDGITLRLGGDTLTASSRPDNWRIVLGYGFENVTAPRGTIKGIQEYNDVMYFANSDGKVRGYNMPTITP